MIRLMFIGIFFLGCYHSMAQAHYWIYFKSPKHLEGVIAPINPAYLSILQSKNVNIIGTSKWFNAAYVSSLSKKNLIKISKLPFVKNIEASDIYKINTLQLQSDSLNYGQADVQLKMLGLNQYHNKGFTGKGVKIGLFDGGFYKVDSIKAFDSLRKRKGILATYDFYDNNKNVYDDDAHGMNVLSLISGFVKDSLQGSAPDASFVLARTEFVATEKHIEEFNWIRALEWADSIGVDIIHSSLGYSLFDSLQGNYSYKDMDGQSTIITRAAEMAFGRGIFITNSAGNEGAKPWHYITAPCDGKNVLCIGAVDSFGSHAKFSSFGPSSDGRIKPDVMAMGKNVTIIGSNNLMRRGSGTSFSGPIMAGFVACLKQSFPNVSNTVLLDAIRKSGHLYLSPNDSMGYGIPNINRADSIIRLKLSAAIPKQNLIKIFPNPCHSLLHFETNLPIDLIIMTDLIGKIYTPVINKNTIDMSEFQAGIYFIQIKNYKVLKLIKI